jgi:hypothetical protein
MDETHTPTTLCWHCDRMLDAASGFGDGDGLVPSSGAVSLCLYCGAVAIFGEDLILRPPTKEELDNLGEDKEFRRSYTGFTWARQYVMLNQSLLRDREDPDR